MSDENTVTEPTVVAEAVPVVEKPTQLSETDKLTLDLAKANRLTGVAEAKAALANSEKNDIAYKYIILQLYMKYGLTAADAIRETGEIVYGGALPQAQG